MKVAALPNKVSGCSSLRRRPFSSSARRQRVALSVRAQDSASSEVATPEQLLAPPVLVWGTDTEGWTDLMGFGGSAPERANGRAAMIGFAAAAAAELASGSPVASQFGDAAATVLLVNVLIGLGTVTPKFLSGTSLAELHAAATGDNLVGGVQDWTQVLRVFDQNTELWSGRLAMLGMVGLVAIETFTGSAFF